PQWRFVGRFEPFRPVRTMRVPDIIGIIEEFASPGDVLFEVHGKEYRLDVAEEPGEEDYFIMFSDQTAGKSTYPSGRFLYVHKPDAQGRTVIDFNQAYTPPCGFTAFATCPLPPRKNMLPLAIEAGETKPSKHPGTE